MFKHYALNCYRYIELNPVRAGMVEDPADYPWSSYRYNALGMKDNRVKGHSLYKALARTRKERCEVYRMLFDKKIKQKTVDEIRNATNKSWVLGSDYFKDKIKDQINRPMNPRIKGGDRKSQQYQKQINRVDPITNQSTTNQSTIKGVIT